MKPGVLFVGVSIAVLLAGCQTTRTFVPAAGDPSSSETVDHQTWRVSEGRDRVAVRWIVPTETAHPHAQLLAIRVTNHSPDDRVLAAGAISVVSGAKAVRSFTPHERARQIERNARLMFLSIEAQRHAEEVSSARLTPDGELLPSPAPAMKAQQAALRLDQTVDAARAEIDRMLGSRVIPAGETRDGLLMLHGEDIVAGQPLTVSVRVGGETYTFRFDVHPGSSAPQASTP